MQESCLWLQDFFRVAERLQDAADAIYGTGSSSAGVARAEWAESLRAYDDAGVRVGRALRRFRAKLTTRTSCRWPS